MKLISNFGKIIIAQTKLCENSDERERRIALKITANKHLFLRFREFQGQRNPMKYSSDQIISRCYNAGRVRRREAIVGTPCVALIFNPPRKSRIRVASRRLALNLMLARDT